MLAERKAIVDNFKAAQDAFNKSVSMSDKNGLQVGLELHQQAVDHVRKATQDLDRLQAVAEGQRFRPMSERMGGLSTAYRDRADRIISTGISYLDDASGGGIGVNDLWIFSATTGSGKTQAMIEIAKSAAKAGKRVAFFALEADDREMEARILFPTLLRLFNTVVENRGKYVDPVKWLRGDPETHKLLAPFVEKAEAEAARDLANLRTMYLGFGKYRAKDLERDVLARCKDSDLIVIDHLGYIALDEGDANKETTDLLFLLRDLVKLDRGVPIITACHTRKSDNRTPKRFAPLVPDRNDIKGSGAIIQCATAVVMLSKVREPVYQTGENAVVQSPTIIQMQKDRRDGRDDFAAVCGFDIKRRTYAPKYGIGRLTKGDTGWMPAAAPPWAENATVNLKPFGAERTDQ